MHRCLLPAAVLFFSLLPCGQVVASGELFLNSRKQGEEISLILENSSNSTITVSEGYALSGLGGGNIIPIVVTSVGQLMPPCAYMDSFVKFKSEAKIGSGVRKVIWKGGASAIARMHCLEPGKYSLSFSYMSPAGTMFFASGTYLLTVSEEFKSTIDLIPRHRP